MTRSTKIGVAGFILVLAGLILNDLAIRIYYWQILLEYADNPTPPPIPPIAGTVFLLLIPMGLILIVYSLYLKYLERNR